ncbi:hypothetical protein [Methylobacterium terrae]|uniref:hypothetical protein n=1 Tax=Methylobacterium terrae TaxID=2202827 RepID=UPI0013A565AC|nr:hypothetical protein [Methylobacterium terrae]
MAEIETWEAAHAASAVRPDTPYVRAARFLNATGDLLAVALVVGSMDLSLPRLTPADEDLSRYQIPSAPRIKPRC